MPLVPEPSDSLTAISLFSGAGGMDVGFSSAGFRIALANELDPQACASYRGNFGDHARCAPIAELIAEDSWPDADCVFGGPPCQGFSVAGKRDPDDPRSRLVWDFFRVIEAVRPRAFVMENVFALAAHKRFAPLFAALRARAGELGYATEALVLNAADHGVAQNRRRLFLVGLRSGSVSDKVAALAAATPTITVREALAPLGPPGSPGNEGVCRARITPAKNPVLRASPYAGMLFNGQGRPINPDGQSCTMTASMGGNKTPLIDEAHLREGKPSWVEAYHARLMRGDPPCLPDDVPPRLRRITVQEAARLQSFPSGHRFAGPQSAVFRQIGNAVPCKLAEAVARAVAAALRDS